ncbi:hypothetical protein TSOC_000067 [Tetrabaena socialis]|uniref:Uncharacterized protein n=1 Tax=Tetrabaena socialis TaxID=47790 RepID=A0A2J8AKA7_9CHLO|nr:hypothetical protein TSOC_000067 [Tetrabaena socialis]|eukprot:PNH12951.1 hypothetical protein TSOC_000067 [Tetrabaena socialis]
MLTGGVWPIELGGYLFDEPGPYTQAYREAYKELAAFGVPPLVDPEDPTQLAAARSTPNETFVLLSTSDREACTTCDAYTRPIRGAWIEGAWGYVGRHGHWHSHLYPLHQPAIGHVHVGTIDGTSDTKNLILKFTDHWDWKLAARAAGGAEHTFYATTGEKELKRDPEPLGHVLAYAPGVVNWRLTKEEFLKAVEQLARAAVALGAVAAWPSAPCDADWVLNDWARNRTRPIQHAIPWVHINASDVVMPFGDSLEALQCEWTGFMHKSCLASPPPPEDTGRALLAVEFRSLLTWVPSSSRAPSANNTIILATTGPASEPPPPASAASTAFTPVPYADLLLLNAERVLQSLPLPEVVWLDRLVEVGEYGERAAAKYDRWQEKCRALRYRGSDMSSKVKW